MTQVIQSAPWDDDEFQARVARSAEGGDRRGSADGEAGGAYELGSHFGGRGAGAARRRRGRERVVSRATSIASTRRDVGGRAGLVRRAIPSRRAVRTSRRSSAS